MAGPSGVPVVPTQGGGYAVQGLYRDAVELDKVCDKCGEVVAREDDAIEIYTIIDPCSIFGITQGRHLLHTDTCEGSPSMAQYIEGQPRDVRPQYRYDDRLEGPIRAAYAKIQAKV